MLTTSRPAPSPPAPSRGVERRDLVVLSQAIWSALGTASTPVASILPGSDEEPDVKHHPISQALAKCRNVGIHEFVMLRKIRESRSPTVPQPKCPNDQGVYDFDVTLDLAVL
jgi:hypothetical protein